MTLQANPNNFLLGVRGNALTHDLALGQSTIQQLTKCGRDASGRPFAGSASGPAVRLPRYEKSAHEGVLTCISQVVHLCARALKSRNCDI